MRISLSGSMLRSVMRWLVVGVTTLVIVTLAAVSHAQESALLFDGVDDVATIADPAGWAPYSPTTSLTVEAWINPSDVSGTSLRGVVRGDNFVLAQNYNDNTALTFQQIADFCGLHSLEVKGIADGEVAQGIQGLDAIASGQLTREEIDRCAEDAGARLVIIESEIELPEPKQRGGKYTPLSRRQDRPNAIAWLVRNHPE